MGWTAEKGRRMGQLGGRVGGQDEGALRSATLSDEGRFAIGVIDQKSVVRLDRVEDRKRCLSTVLRQCQ